MNHRLIAATLAGVLAVMAAGCATAPPVHYSLVPIKANGQDLPGLDGKTTLESRQPGGIVSVRASPDFADFGAGFIVAVQNKSAGPLVFGPENIEATTGGQKLAVLTAEELDAKVKADLRGYLRATSRTGTVDLEQASAEVAREYQFNNYGGHPAGTASLAYDIDNGSNYRQDRLNRELEAKTVRDAALALQQNEALLKRALRPATVAPEQMAGGVMIVQPPKDGGPVDLTITFNGQKHHFTFNAKPTA